jgi:alpha-methylacyl-CoA racemase
MMGPLQGVKIVEFAAPLPVTFCAMLLADMGADVIRVDRVVNNEIYARFDPRFEFNRRNRRSISLDLKSPDAIDVVRKLLGEADALIEGYRPGVMERLGIGPEPCHAANRKLVYGRLTGWGQEGPLARHPGHDLNFLALAGGLHYLGVKGQPPIPPPQGMLGDLGCGALYLALGVVSALYEARESGEGQVVDAAIIDGVTSFLTPTHGRRMATRPASDDVIAGRSRPWYRPYQTKDGRWVTVGALEGKFYKELLQRLGIDDEAFATQPDVADWPALERRFAEVFAQNTLREWMEIMEGAEACFTPVLNLPELIEHPHAQARGMFAPFEGQLHPMPAPRFSRTKSSIDRPPACPGADTDGLLTEIGYSSEQIATLKTSGAVA